MKFANYQNRAVLTDGNRAVYVGEASGGRFPDTADAVFDVWEEFARWGKSLDVSDGFALEFEKLNAPSPLPRQIFGIGLNYSDHSRESGVEPPAEPAVFTKFQTSIAGPVTQLVLPTDTVDWEAELVVAIGRQSYRVTPEQAWDHVAGLTVGQDISERTRQLAGPVPQFSLGKSFPGFSPIGPWIVTVDEFDDPDNVALGCAVNDQTMQDGSTKDLIFSVPQLIAQLSTVCPLLPGDLIFTGTPAGVGGARKPPVFLRSGDVLTTWAEGIGRITSTCVAAAETAA
jgi:2,4-didehydro-3-deoxy-L-rhamnonate hydrolase